MPNLVEFRGRLIDLDAHRASKARAARRTQYREWPVTRAQYNRACELVLQLEGLREGSDAYRAVVEDLKSIPGYPKDFNPEGPETLVFRITDTAPSFGAARS